MHDRASIEERFRLVRASSTFRRIVDSFGLSRRKTLDLGCSYGEHLVHFGAGSLGVTSTSEEVSYGRTRGLRMIKGNVETLDELNIDERFEGIWSNNLFEHLLSPHAFLIRLKTIARPDTLLVLGLPVLPRIMGLMRIAKFRGALASNHVNFFTAGTLRLTVLRAGWIVEDIRPFVSCWRWLDDGLRTFAPHLYVVARNDASFEYPEKKLKEWRSVGYYDPLLQIVADVKARAGHRSG